MSKPAMSVMFAGATAALLFAGAAHSTDHTPAPATPDSASAVATLPPQVKAQVDSSASRRVQREFDFSLGDITRILTPQQLRSALGVDDARISNTPGPADQQLERIEVHASRTQPVQTRIPFGLASIAWGVTHPRDAWRIFAPVVFG